MTTLTVSGARQTGDAPTRLRNVLARLGGVLRGGISLDAVEVIELLTKIPAALPFRKGVLAGQLDR